VRYVTTTVDEEILQKVEELTKQEKRTRAQMLRILVEEALEARKNKESK
jgi:metal-responsive CopG/Arc/MetJ family transcriptional regulator